MQDDPSSSGSAAPGAQGLLSWEEWLVLLEAWRISPETRDELVRKHGGSDALADQLAACLGAAWTGPGAGLELGRRTRVLHALLGGHLELWAPRPRALRLLAALLAQLRADAAPPAWRASAAEHVAVLAGGVLGPQLEAAGWAAAALEGAVEGLLEPALLAGPEPLRARACHALAVLEGLLPGLLAAQAPHVLAALQREPGPALPELHRLAGLLLRHQLARPSVAPPLVPPPLPDLLPFVLPPHLRGPAPPPAPLLLDKDLRRWVAALVEAAAFLTRWGALELLGLLTHLHQLAASNPSLAGALAAEREQISAQALHLAQAGQPGLAPALAELERAMQLPPAVAAGVLAAAEVPRDAPAARLLALALVPLLPPPLPSPATLAPSVFDTPAVGEARILALIACYANTQSASWLAAAVLRSLHLIDPSVGSLPAAAREKLAAPAVRVLVRLASAQPACVAEVLQWLDHAVPLAASAGEVRLLAPATQLLQLLTTASPSAARDLLQLLAARLALLRPRTRLLQLLPLLGHSLANPQVDPCGLADALQLLLAEPQLTDGLSPAAVWQRGDELVRALREALRTHDQPRARHALAAAIAAVAARYPDEEVRQRARLLVQLLRHLPHDRAVAMIGPAPLDDAAGWLPGTPGASAVAVPVASAQLQLELERVREPPAALPQLVTLDQYETQLGAGARPVVPLHLQLRCRTAPSPGANSTYIESGRAAAAVVLRVAVPGLHGSVEPLRVAHVAAGGPPARVVVPLQPLLPLPLALEASATFTDEAGRPGALLLPPIEVLFADLLLPVLLAAASRTSLFGRLWARFSGPDDGERGEALKALKLPLSALQRALHDSPLQPHLLPDGLRVMAFLPPRFHLLLLLESRGVAAAVVHIRTDCWRALPFIDDLLEQLAAL